MDKQQSGRKSSKHWGEFQKQHPEPMEYYRSQWLKLISHNYRRTAEKI